MAQECGFFNAQLVGENEYDRVYLAEQFAAYFASFIGNGVFGQSMQKLEVLSQSVPDMTIQVLSGEAWINGWWYRNTDTYTLGLQIADGVLSRIDAVVLRWGNVERDMWLTVITGEPSANPKAPALRRDADYYDLQLATVSINAGTIKITQAQIKDTRLNNAVCGLVTGVVDQIDTTNLYNQFEAYFEDFKNRYEADYDQWTTEQKQAYIDYITNLESSYDQWTSQQKQDYINYINATKLAYDTWVNNRQDDYDQWTAQKMLEYTQFVSSTEQDYNEWTEEQKEKYNEWYIIHTTTWTKEFTEWFENLKDILSGDVAGNLQLEIEDLQKRVAKLEEFEYNLVEKQEVYPMMLDTQLDKIIGELTTETDETIVDELGNVIDIIGELNEPILDNNSDKIRSIIKFCIL